MFPIKIKFIFLLIFSIIYFINCKTATKSSLQLEYYDLIYKAELEIVQGNESKAFDFYNNAFEIKCSHFAKDYYNFLVICETLKEDIRTPLSKLLSYGLSIEYICRDSLLKISIKNFLSKIENEGFIIDIQSNINVDKEYHKKLDTLFELDQSWRIKDVALDGKGYNDYLVEIDSFNQIVGNNLLNLISDYGFPSEKKIGYIDTFPLNMQYSYFFPLLHQNYENRTIELESLLMNAVVDGDLHPESVAMVLDYHLKSQKFGLMPSPYFKAKVISSFIDRRISDIELEKLITKLFENEPLYETLESVEKIDYFNRNRKSIGLPSQIIFGRLMCLRNPKSRYKYIFGNPSIFPLSDSISYLKFIENATIIKNDCL